MKPVGRRLAVHGKGFSLLEILVAFAVMAMSLGLIYRITGSTVSQAGRLTVDDRLNMVAQSLLQRFDVLPPGGVHEQGESAGIAWQARTTPAESAPLQAAARPPAPLYRLDLSLVVMNEETGRRLDLTTLRFARTK